jgi:hypothetical protein
MTLFIILASLPQVSQNFLDPMGITIYIVIPSLCMYKTIIDCHVLEVFLVHLWYPKTFAKGACESDKIYKYSYNYLKVHHENYNVYLP